MKRLTKEQLLKVLEEGYEQTPPQFGVKRKQWTQAEKDRPDQLRKEREARRAEEYKETHPVTRQEQAEYVKLLKNQNWLYQRSDDIGTFKNGSATMDRIRFLQQRGVDKDRSLWNQYKQQM